MINIICFMMRAIYQRASVAMDIKPRGGGGGVVKGGTMPRCVCPKVKNMGPFLASRE